MTGRSSTDPDEPLGKEDSAVLIFMKPLESGKGSLKDGCKTTPCIKCGRCAKACPAGLMPMRIEKAVKKIRPNDLKRLRPDLCIKCGSCTYVCPAKHDLAEVIEKAVTLLNGKDGE